MAEPSETSAKQLIRLPIFFIVCSSLFIPRTTAAYSIGVNYGTVTDNLPPPPQVATFIKDQTIIDKVKIFDTNPDILRAFSNSGIAVTVTVANDDIPDLAKLPVAQSWVANNVLPFYPRTKICRIAVGNEVIATSNKTLIAHLLPAMKSLYAALNLAGVTEVQVATPHSLGILAVSDSPSSGRFRRVYDRAIFSPMLEFHRQTKSPFMISPYPFFGFTAKTLNYALFRPNGSVFDEATGLNYTNMFDAQLDVVYSAMKRLGYDDVDIVVAETGWPSAGDQNQQAASLDNAVSFIGNVIKYVNSGKGTPLMSNRTFETFIFALFNEDLKPSTTERNFGLFRPDLSPVYDVGVLREGQSGGGATPPTPAPAPAVASKKWCVAKQDASDEALQENIFFACGSAGVDCTAIRGGGVCFEPNIVRSHASFAMNAYYQANGRNDFDCYFINTGFITTADPSYRECQYLS